MFLLICGSKLGDRSFVVTTKFLFLFLCKYKKKLIMKATRWEILVYGLNKRCVGQDKAISIGFFFLCCTNFANKSFFTLKKKKTRRKCKIKFLWGYFILVFISCGPLVNVVVGIKFLHLLTLIGSSFGYENNTTREYYVMWFQLSSNSNINME